jgi:septal ring factor EnvC (AmiA/AmiB activator)
MLIEPQSDFQIKTELQNVTDELQSKETECSDLQADLHTAYQTIEALEAERVELQDHDDLKRQLDEAPGPDQRA